MADNTVFKVKDYSPGAVTTCRSLLIEDAFVQDSSVEVSLRQPAGTILSKAVFRFDTAVDAAATSTITVDIGASDDKDGIIDGGVIMAANAADPAANAVVVFEETAFIGQHAPGATTGIATASKSYAAKDRDLFVTIITSDHAIAANGDIAVTLFFDVIG